ncbi:hypothetical protein SNE40_016019 [Patella caerulea]
MECSICHRQFTKPKALPCLHTFCEECLRSYIASNPDSEHARGGVPCPACRQTIYIPAGGVSELPDNPLALMITHNFIGQDTGELPPSYQTLFGEKAFDPEASDVSFVDNPSVAKLVHSFGSHGSNEEQCTFLSGLAINEITNEIVVSDCSLNKVTIFSLKGQFKRSFVCNCSIRDVCVTAQGTLLLSVSRSGSALLREYHSDGRLVGVYGSHYHYENPYGVAMDSMQRVVVTSLEKNMIHLLTEQKRPSINFGSKGSGPNHFFQPYFVTVNGRDDVVVSDSGNHRIKVHGLNGQLKLIIGGQGHREGQFFYPLGLCVDKWDNIYVADSNNYRVQVFSPEGQFLSSPVKKTFQYGADVKPTNIALFGDNKMVVALRGSKFCQINIYQFQLSAHIRSYGGKDGGNCCSLLCCFSPSVAYDEM